jgi:hypothetical protein
VAERALVSETISPSQAPTITHTDNGWTLTWSPADRAALIRYSSDGGQTWETLGVDITGGEFELALEDMTAGELQFEILSSDQFSTAQRLNWGNTSFP